MCLFVCVRVSISCRNADRSVPTFKVWIRLWYPIYVLKLFSGINVFHILVNRLLMPGAP